MLAKEAYMADSLKGLATDFDEMNRRAGFIAGAERICIIVPAYNVEATLRPLLETLLLFSTQLVVVDDGSGDGTASIVDEFTADHLILLRHEKNLGKGTALRTGFKWAISNGFEIAVTLDSDLQHAPEDLPRILEVFERNCLDVLLGDRFHNSGKMPRVRRFGNKFSSWIASRFCHQRIHDSQCGYRIYRLTSCKSVLTDLTLERFDSETEVIVKAALKKLKIGFSPITVIYPDDASHCSHYRTFWDTALIIWFYTREICRRIFTKRGRRDVKIIKRHADTFQQASGMNIVGEIAE